jgi:hypothetical protein
MNNESEECGRKLLLSNAKTNILASWKETTLETYAWMGR